MREMNLCNGCFYAGVADGFKPECDCVARSKYEADNETWRQEAEDVYRGNGKTPYQRHIERRKNRAKANQKAREAYLFAESKINKLSAYATNEEFWRLEKKCRNMDKKAKRNEQVTILLSLPTKIEIKKTKGGSISKIKRWMESTPTIATECKEAIKTLELAKSSGGEVVASFRDKAELYVTIGFYSKKELNSFKRKYEKAS